VGFIVTNLATDSHAVVRFYNQQGTAEQWIGEDKPAVKMTRLSCHLFRSNEVRETVAWVTFGPSAAKQDRQLVADELVATVREDRRTIGETRPLLLARTRKYYETTKPINPSHSAGGLPVWPDAPDEPLQRLPKLLGAQAGIPHNAAHGMSVDGIMPGNRDDAHAVGHDDVLPLPRDSKSGPFQRLDGAQVRDARDLSHALCRHVHFPRLCLRG
jgi:hypothetical protein